MKLVPGDCVTLVSGGPELTVLSVDETDAAVVVWFDKKDRLRRRDLPVAILVRVNVVSS